VQETGVVVHACTQEAKAGGFLGLATFRDPVRERESELFLKALNMLFKI
jgi:hypothetical protein